MLFFNGPIKRAFWFRGFHMHDKYYLKIGRASELINSKDWYFYRFLEILPGFISWLTFFLIILFSWLLPFYIAIFIIAFDIYWFFKTVFLSLHMRSAFNKMKANLKKNWLREYLCLQTWSLMIFILTFSAYKPDIRLNTLKKLS